MLIDFANKEFFLFLLLVPAMIYWYWLKHNRTQAEIQISSLEGLETSSSESLLPILRHLLFSFRIIGIILLIIALARPQSSTSWQEVKTEGIDIAIAMDISTSMLARDFNPNRLESAKEKAMEFIDARPNDRIGLVLFSGESFTQCPLTTDHSVLKNLFSEIKTGIIKDGTAIGLGLGTAVNRLRDSEAKSKVIILLTDGENNAGDITPLDAAALAKEKNVRVYTIGVGTIGKALFPAYMDYFGNIQYQMQDVKIDEKLLTSIAESTGGKYFRAVDANKLKEIYHEIDQLEKTKINSTEFRKRSEKFFWFAFIGSLLILFEIMLRYTLFRSVP